MEGEWFMPEEMPVKPVEIEQTTNFWLNENNIEKFQVGYKIFLGIIVLIVLINVLLPLWLRRDQNYVVTKTGCIGIDINQACIGFAKYSKEVRKGAIFE